MTPALVATVQAFVAPVGLLLALRAGLYLFGRIL